jgi:serine/threonine protein kinase
MDRDRLITEMCSKPLLWGHVTLTVQEELGRGGNGVALLCRDEADGELVAKVYVPPDKRDLDDQALARFHNEIKLCESLNHPHVVRSLGSGTVKIGAYALPFYVMPPAATTFRSEIGKSLDATAIERVAKKFLQACLGVSCLHSHHVIHRDLKPENILLSRQGAPWIADLGIAHIDPDFVSVSLRTIAAERLLNRDYYAPEQRFSSAQQVDGRADIYALGCILYELFVGYPPVRKDSPPAASINKAFAALDPVIDRMTAYDPAARYQHIEDAIADLALAFGWVRATMTGARSPAPADLKSMEKGLRSSNAVNRSAGVAIAVDLGTQALPVLHDLLGHNRRDVRNAVADALGEIGDPSSLPYLVAGLYGQSDKASIFRPSADTATQALGRYSAEHRIEAARMIDRKVRPQQILELVDGIAKNDAYVIARELESKKLILFDWGETQFLLRLGIDEDRTWPEVKEAGTRFSGWEFRRILPSLSAAHGDELVAAWLDVPHHDSWAWDGMAPVIVERTYQSRAHAEDVMQNLSVALDHYPGAYQKGEELRKLVRQKLDTLTDKKPGA